MNDICELFEYAGPLKYRALLGRDDGVDPFQNAAYGHGTVRYYGTYEVLQCLAFYQPLYVLRFVAVSSLDVPATRTTHL